MADTALSFVCSTFVRFYVNAYLLIPAKGFLPVTLTPVSVSSIPRPVSCKALRTAPSPRLRIGLFNFALAERLPAHVPDKYRVGMQGKGTSYSHRVHS